MLLVVILAIILKGESVSLVTMKKIAIPVTLELGLVLEDGLIKPTHVETKATWSPDNGDKHIKAMGYILVQ